MKAITAKNLTGIADGRVIPAGTSVKAIYLGENRYSVMTEDGVCVGTFNGSDLRDLRPEEAESVRSASKADPGMKVATSMGTIIASESGFGDGYPGIWIDFQPKGRAYGIGIALIEVKEAGEETGLSAPEFHFRPFVAEEAGTLDENGTMIPGKISNDAPFGDICISASEFAECFEEAM